MKYKYSLSSAFKFGWPGIKGFAFNSKDDFPRASAALFIVESRHGRVRNTVSDRVYLVLDGEGLFTINGEETAVRKNDVVIVPKNTEYDYQWKMTLFLVHSPAYDATCDLDLENLQQSQNST